MTHPELKWRLHPTSVADRSEGAWTSARSAAESGVRSCGRCGFTSSPDRPRPAAPPLSPSPSSLTFGLSFPPLSTSFRWPHPLEIARRTALHLGSATRSRLDWPLMTATGAHTRSRGPPAGPAARFSSCEGCRRAKVRLNRHAIDLNGLCWHASGRARSDPSLR